MSNTVVLAVAAAALALTALILTLISLLAMRKLRIGQLAVLADGKADLVDFAVSLQARIDDLYKAVDEIASALTRVDKRFDGALSNVALIRYDAYGDRGGQQSATVAILDSGRSGIVLSAIQGRDYARIYVKELDRGNCAITLSPEEEEAIRRAMAR
ncbi:MAG: DUF4446 family protein [Gaiellaceae bacterium]|jgi:hypothetical protein